MNELEALKERKRRAEEALAKGFPFKVADYKKYLAICDEIGFLEGISQLLKSAPESMNPNKFEAHMEGVTFFLKRHLYTPQTDDFIKALEQFYVKFNPTHVESYKKSLMKWAMAAIKLYKENNKI